MNFYLLADDLSGALEAGAAFRARGRRVRLTLNTSAPLAADVLQVLSSETRNASGPDAARILRELLEAQRAAGNQLLFKKIDSTLRGSIGAEVRTLIEVLAPPLVVVCPANPAAGRTVRDGCLLVRGIPVAETEFHDDPGAPVDESRVANVLAVGGVEEITPLALAELRSLPEWVGSEKHGVVVSDAETAEDLQRLVVLIRRSVPAAVFVGSGGLAQALALNEGQLQRGSWRIPDRVLIVSGSKSARSRRQLEILHERNAVPLQEIGPFSNRDPMIVGGIARALCDCGIASLTIAKDFPASDPSAPVRRLTEVVTALAAGGAEPGMLAATGGETARALCVALGVNHLDLLDEIEPGVIVAGVASSIGGNLSLVVIKPGGFGTECVWSALITDPLGLSGAK